MSARAVAIVGAAETERIGTVADMSTLELHAEASRRATADAGLGAADIDGLAVAIPSPIEIAYYLGLQPRWVDGTMVGGCSLMVLVRHAAAAIAAGLCETVLVSHGESGRSGIGTTRRMPSASSLPGQFELPYGGARPMSTFTTPALRFLAQRGMGIEHLAEVVVAQRRWCRDDPRALRREQVSVADVLAAPMVADPFTRDMCCPVTDGGGALVLVAAERVAELELSAPPVYLWGAGEAVETPIASQMEDLGSFAAFRRAGGDAFASAGVTPGEIDHLMVYDPFAHVPLYGLEDLGFVGFGESGEFVAGGHTSPGGSLPMNTNGGGLNYTHTGMYGMFAILEAVRQLRGEAVAQVAGVQRSFVIGVGMSFGAAGALVLAGSPR